MSPLPKGRLYCLLAYVYKGHKMARLKIGDRAPDLVLKDVEGAAVPLADTWGNGRHALLIFLRHLA